VVEANPSIASTTRRVRSGRMPGRFSAAERASRQTPVPRESEEDGYCSPTVASSDDHAMARRRPVLRPRVLYPRASFAASAS